MSGEWDELKRLLARPAADPEALHESADRVLGLVVRGDCRIGILPLEAVDDLIEAERRAARAGLAEARRGLGSIVDALVLGDLGASEYAARAADAAAELGDRGAVLRAAKLWTDREEEGRAARAAALVRRLCEDDADGSAHRVLGYMVFRGYGLPSDAAESYRLHSIAAERGDADSMFELYALLSSGQGVARDEAKALEWNRRAAEKGQPRALYNMGAFLATGRGMPRDLAQALQCYLRASDAGNGRASFTAGVMLWTGEGCKEDRARARERFDLAEEQGVDVEPLLEDLGISRGG